MNRHIGFTRHGLKRTQEMGLSKAAVRSAIKASELSYCCGPNPGEQVSDLTIYVCDPLAIVLDRRDRVVTVLWHRQDQWHRDAIEEVAE